AALFHRHDLVQHGDAAVHHVADALGNVAVGELDDGNAELIGKIVGNVMLVDIAEAGENFTYLAAAHRGLLFVDGLVELLLRNDLAINQALPKQRISIVHRKDSCLSLNVPDLGQVVNENTVTSRW